MFFFSLFNLIFILVLDFYKLGIPFSEGTKVLNKLSEKHDYMVLPLEAFSKYYLKSYGSQEDSENYTSGNISWKSRALIYF